MKSLSSAAAIAALLAANLPAQAQQRPYLERGAAAAQPKAVGGPLKVIYRVAGVINSDGAHGTGVATSFLCTSASAVDETLRIAVRTSGGFAAGTQATMSIEPNETKTVSTNFTNLFTSNAVLAAGVLISQGSAYVMATSNKIFCSAMIMDAAATVPQGIALHMVRFDPALGSQE